MDRWLTCTNFLNQIQSHSKCLTGHYLFGDELNCENGWIRLAGLIDWHRFESIYARIFSTTGRPGIRGRLVLGSLILKHELDVSDEELLLQSRKSPICSISSALRNSGYSFWRQHADECSSTPWWEWIQEIWTNHDQWIGCEENPSNKWYCFRKRSHLSASFAAWEIGNSKTHYSLGDNRPEKGDYQKYCGQRFWKFISEEKPPFQKYNKATWI